MAIEITKLGKIPEEKKFNLICECCSTEFICVRGDMSVSPDQRDPGLFVNCPLCKSEVWKPTGFAGRSFPFAQYSSAGSTK